MVTMHPFLAEALARRAHQDMLDRAATERRTRSLVPLRPGRLRHWLGIRLIRFGAWLAETPGTPVLLVPPVIR